MRRYDLFISYVVNGHVVQKHKYSNYFKDEIALVNYVQAKDVFMFNDTDGSLLFHNTEHAIERYQALIQDGCVDEELYDVERIFHTHPDAAVWFESRVMEELF